MRFVVRRGARRSNRRTGLVPRSSQSRRDTACPGARGLMIFGVYGPEPTQNAFAERALARGAPRDGGPSVAVFLRRRRGLSRRSPRPHRGRLACVVSLTWFLVGAPTGVATADACAYASVGPDGTQAVAVAGDLAWPTPPVCPAPTPTPTPTPTPRPAPPEPKPPPPAPTPTPKPTPKPTPRPKPPLPAPPAAKPAAPRPRTTPPAAPPPAPAPKPSAKPAHRTFLAPVTYPRYRAPAPKRSPRGGPSPVTFVLLITVPAVIAVAALRPR